MNSGGLRPLQKQTMVGKRSKPDEDFDTPMDEIVAELVAKYRPTQMGDSSGATPVKSITDFESDEDLISDLEAELSIMLEGRNEPLDMRLFTLAILKAMQILRGKG